MKRDMNLVRLLLLGVEGKPTPDAIRMEDIEIEGVPDSSERRKHFVMMAQAGFLDCETTRSKSNPERIFGVAIFDLSWNGHEYLDAIRDPKIWRQTQKLASKTGNASFDFIIETAKALATDVLKSGGLWN